MVNIVEGNSRLSTVKDCTLLGSMSSLCVTVCKEVGFFWALLASGCGGGVGGRSVTKHGPRQFIGQCVPALYFLVLVFETVKPVF